MTSANAVPDSPGWTSLRAPPRCSRSRELHEGLPGAHSACCKSGHVSAVDNVSFEVEAGTTVGIVGESGCGKSTTARLILGLIEPDAGEIAFDATWQTWRKTSARKTCAATCRWSSRTPTRRSTRASRSARASPSRCACTASAGAESASARRTAGAGRPARQPRLVLPAPDERRSASAREHRAGAGARSEAGDRDEAVSALDKSVQAQVLNLLRTCRRRWADLHLHQPRPQRRAVHGDRVSSCTSARSSRMRRRGAVRAPLHPYTQALLASIPDVDPADRRARLEGEIPSPLDPPSGCRFRTRCPHAMAVCAEERPAMRARAGH